MKYPLFRTLSFPSAASSNYCCPISQGLEEGGTQHQPLIQSMQSPLPPQSPTRELPAGCYSPPQRFSKVMFKFLSGNILGCRTKQTGITIFLVGSKIGQNGGASRWRVCYKRGLPHLVLSHLAVLSPLMGLFVFLGIQNFTWDPWVFKHSPPNGYFGCPRSRPWVH